MKKNKLAKLLSLAMCLTCAAGAGAIVATTGMNETVITSAAVPENPNLNITTTDLLAAPSESAWEQATAYDLISNDDTTTGATGKIKIYTVGGKVYFRLNITDTTTISGKDGIFITFDVDGNTYNAVGNFAQSDSTACWFSVQANTLGLPDAVLNESAMTASTGYVSTLGFDLSSIYSVGKQFKMRVAIGDCQAAESDWSVSETGYSHYVYFDQTVTFGAKAVENANPNLNIVVTDLASQPTENDWSSATAYNLIAKDPMSTGATGTMKVFTAGGNLYFRLTVNDATTHVVNDFLKIEIWSGDYALRKYGNYDLWLVDFAGAENFSGNQPSLLACTTTATNAKAWENGTYTFDFGWYVPEVYGVGNTVNLRVTHGDSQSETENWDKHDGFAHTIYFDQTLTFGEKNDPTVRPETPTSGFTGGTESISYNKANITWSEFTGAETYKLYVYTVNAQGSAEPYTHLSIEGPFYAGDGTYSEAIAGLSATTAYAVQVIAYDSAEAVIGTSELITFSTISRQEALNPTPGEGEGGNEGGNEGGETGGETGGNENEGGNTDDKKDEEKKSGGCGSSLAATGIGMGIAMLGAAVVAKKRRK